jgi:hypothetical protein
MQKIIKIAIKEETVTITIIIIFFLDELLFFR